MSKNARYYRAAAEQLKRPNGWAKGAFYGGNGGQCLLQSVAVAMGHMDHGAANLPESVVDELFAELVKHYGDQPDVTFESDTSAKRAALIGWNDSDGVRKSNVVMLLSGMSDTKPTTKDLPSPSVQINLCHARRTHVHHLQ